MEEYLGTYLNMKYGLPSLIIDTNNAILAHTERYRHESPLVRLYAHMLVNEVDEDYVEVQRTTKVALDEFIHAFLRGKQPPQPEAKVEEQRKMIVVHGGRMGDDIVSAAVSFLMEREEEGVEDAVRERIREAVAEDEQRLQERQLLLEQTVQMARSAKRIREVPQITYPILLKIISDALIDQHLAYLAPFVELFLIYAIVNPATNAPTGKINEKNFIRLVQRMKTTCGEAITEKQMDKLLEKIDPYCAKVITFTQCVRGLANEIDALYKHTKHSRT